MPAFKGLCEDYLHICTMLQDHQMLYSLIRSLTNYEHVIAMFLRCFESLNPLNLFESQTPAMIFPLFLFLPEE